MPNISAIIINWNTRRILLDCLASVYRTASDLMGEVWVVDNGSSDGSFHAVQRIYPQARLICNRENRGFSQACNQALKVITGRYALLLNTDVVLQNEAVERLRDFLEANPKVAMAGGQLLHEDGRKQNSFAPFPSLLTELTHKGLLRFLFPQKFSTRTSNGYGFQEAEFLAPRSSVDSLVGACMLVRMEALRQVGLLDEDYFFFLEETDWCYRFRKAGWAIGYVPQARIIHLQGQTAKAHPARARIEYCRSRYLFFRKHRGRTKSAVLQGGLFLRFTLDLFFMTLLNLLTLFSLPHCREKLGIYGQIVHWHLQGCPEEMGLKECKKENAKGKDPRYPFIETQENPKSAGKPKGRLADWPRVEMGGIRWRVRLDCFDRLSPLLRNNQLPHGCRMVKTNR
ncbi:MAG: glycosyltransferase family 2 protein, partial [Candidatus Binatia bacterium]|nr:glycosyltransferase family 2 protein [Candidatus Binatia bacterium]